MFDKKNKTYLIFINIYKGNESFFRNFKSLSFRREKQYFIIQLINNETRLLKKKQTKTKVVQFNFTDIIIKYIFKN